MVILGSANHPLIIRLVKGWFFLSFVPIFTWKRWFHHHMSDVFVRRGLLV